MIKTILKGMVIGVANIIPGVSGGTMAVSMGIYDTLISSITNLFKDLKKSLRTLLPIGIGVILGLVGLSFVIEYLFEHYPLQTNLLFIGLIVGGLPDIWKKVAGRKTRPGHLLAGILFFLLVAGMAAFGGGEGAEADLSFSLISVIKLFFVGIVASATMVIPGVSGSMMLMLMGYYEPIISTITVFIKAGLAFDIPALLTGAKVLVPMGVGIVLGIFLIAKIIEFIFAKFPLYAYWAIIGLIVASPIAILLMGSMGSLTVFSVATAAAALLLGFFLARRLGGE